MVAREGQERRSGCDLEKARRQILTRVEHFAQQCGEFGVADQLSGDADAFVVAHQMRLGRGVDGEALRLEDRAQIGASRALAVGPGDMEHGGQATFGMAEPVAQCADGFQPEAALGQG